jgi:acyl-CoA synthetase (AMP-forming)/AMP-acid ligase II/acyl carrier protein
MHLTRHWSQVHPEQTAYCFLEKGKETGSLSYRELDIRARAIGRELQKREAAGERTILLFPQGLDYLCAFYGCLYSAVVAITTSLPRGERRIERVLAIMEDSGARFALTNRRTLRQLQGAGWDERLSALDWLVVDEIPSTHSDAWRQPKIDRDTLAFLQYTSGSTATPKGVMLSHGNLLSNVALMEADLRNHTQSVFVSWLPLFHDMGLILIALSTVYNGAPCYLMSPDEFIRRPLAWLEAITRYRGTVTAAPDFAYRLCLGRISDDELTDIDLSSMETMLNGAEVIRAGTVERFRNRFSRYGLNPQALYAGYGLAESSVYVAGEHIRDPMLRFDRVALEAGRAQPTEGDGVALVRCGPLHNIIDIRIVDPEHCTEVEPGQVGEIWVDSGSNGQGYWGRPEQSEETLKARLATDNGRRYLRTGDLGFDHEGRLYICGRIKNLIIIRGRNLYPDDVGTVVEDCDERLKSRPSSAFGVELNEQEELVVVIALNNTDEETAELIERIRLAIARRIGVEPMAVLLVPNNNISRTTSGKIQHSRIRQDFLNHQLNIRAHWMHPQMARWWHSLASADAKVTGIGAHPTQEQCVTKTNKSLQQIVENLLRERIAALGGQPVQAIDADRSLVELGFDSLKILTLIGDIEKRLQVEIGTDEAGSSLHQLIETIAQRITPKEGEDTPMRMEKVII